MHISETDTLFGRISCPNHKRLVNPRDLRARRRFRSSRPPADRRPPPQRLLAGRDARRRIERNQLKLTGYARLPRVLLVGLSTSPYSTHVNQRLAVKERFRKDKGKNKAIDELRARLRPFHASSSESTKEIDALKEIQKKQDAAIEYIQELLNEQQDTVTRLPFPDEFESLLNWFSGFEERIDARDRENERLRTENKRLHREMNRLKESFQRLEASVRALGRQIEGLPPRYQRRTDPDGRPWDRFQRSPLSAEILPNPIDTELAERRGRSLRGGTPVIVQDGYSRESSADATVVSQEGTLKRQRDEEEPRDAAVVADGTITPERDAPGRQTWMNTILADPEAPPTKIRRVKVIPPREGGVTGDR